MISNELVKGKDSGKDYETELAIKWTVGEKPHVCMMFKGLHTGCSPVTSGIMSLQRGKLGSPSHNPVGSRSSGRGGRQMACASWRNAIRNTEAPKMYSR